MHSITPANSVACMARKAELFSCPLVSRKKAASSSHFAIKEGEPESSCQILPAFLFYKSFAEHLAPRRDFLDPSSY